ncbi:Ankyrin repeat domain-containing protein 50 [Colletotrichum siamense]|nr:Ankyrin repeat domain-containing protein 50 [Colletotrichum siamense]
MRTPLHTLLSTTDNEESVMKVLEERLGEWSTLIDIRSPLAQETALLMAVCEGWERIVCMLLQAGANVDIGDDSGRLPLQVACQNGNQAIVEELLKFGANPNKSSSDGQYPLDDAVKWPFQPQIFKQLVEPQKRSINKIYHDSRWTPLNKAVYYGTENAIDILLEAGADLSVVDTDKWTPLMTAIHQGNLNIVEKLLFYLSTQAKEARQSAIDSPDSDGVTPIMLLCGRSTLGDSPRVSAMALKTVRKLLELGPDVSAIDLEDNTVLHHAMKSTVQWGNDLVIRLIVLMPEDRILQSNVYGETAFDSCFDKDIQGPSAVRDDLVRFLTDLFARDKTPQEAEKPLCWAVYRLERHSTALEIFNKLHRAGKIRERLNPHTCSMVEWAIHARLPRVLLTYLRAVGLDRQDNTSSTVGEDREKGSKLIEDLRREYQSPISRPSEAERQRGQTDQKPFEQTRERDRVLEDLEDILDYLYPEKAERRVSPWDLSEQTKPMKEVSKTFRAAIIQNNFFKFRNVQEMLYDSYQMENVRQTVERLRKLEYHPNAHKQRSSHISGVESDFKAGPHFTWIHLPASNVSLCSQLGVF